MPVSDLFSLFARTAGDAAIYRNAAMTLAACIAIVAINESSATAVPAEFVVVSLLDVAAPATHDGLAPTSFENRFVEPQASLMQEVIDRSLHSAPLASRRTASLPRSLTIVSAGPAMIGIASMYNPNDPYDPDAGNKETASGEPYNAEDWTAAIQIELREQFGGIRFGVNYQPAFVLVQTDDKQAIVRINDVGPLRPGRIIDLNERAMRYFDPDLQRGLLPDVRVTPLAGRDWVAGPVIEDLRVNVASGVDR